VYTATSPQLLVNEDPQVLLLRAALYPFSVQLVFMLGIASIHVQDLELGLIELPKVCTRKAHLSRLSFF